jgi:hypothetical protein
MGLHNPATVPKTGKIGCYLQIGDDGNFPANALNVVVTASHGNAREFFRHCKHFLYGFHHLYGNYRAFPKLCELDSVMKKFTRKDFLEALFDDYFTRKEGFILVRTVRNMDKRVSTRYFPNIEILSKEQYQPDQHVFFGVCPHEKMKPEKTCIQYVTALWSGLDISPEGYSGKKMYFFGHAQAAKAVRSFPLPPSIIVQSGTGLHLYWLLKELTRLDNVSAFEELLTKINKYFQCNSPVQVDSSLRLPGTHNCKTPPHDTECRIKYINTDFRYDLEEFDKLNLSGTGSPVKSGSFLESTSVGLASAVAVQPSVQKDEPKPTEYAVKNQGEENLEEPEYAGSALDSEELESLGLLENPADSQTVVILAEESADLLAEEIVTKVVDRLSEKLMDELVDRIVDRLASRLTNK